MRARITHVSAAVVLLAAACAKPEQKAAPATPPPAPPVVTIHAHDFAYVAPDTVPGGLVTFRLVNDGPSLHHATIVRIDSGKTVSEMLAALKKGGNPPAWIVPIGGPNAPAPGDTSNATVDLAPGNYALVCFVDVPGGIPHFMHGMVHGFTVVDTTAATAPTADVDVTLVDYAFQYAAPLTSGHHVFKVTNHGTQPHELELVKLAPGKTAKDLLAWLQKPVGPPPGLPMGGTAMEVPGRTDYFSADITPGNYLSICFVPDAKDGKPHFMHGMMNTQTVN